MHVIMAYKWEKETCREKVFCKWERGGSLCMAGGYGEEKMANGWPSGKRRGDVRLA